MFTSHNLGKSWTLIWLDTRRVSLQEVLDRHTDAWGVKVTSVELKHVDLPSEMQRAMAKQAEAERERRAKVIAAEGEVQASTKLAEAAATIAKAPGAMTLRYLQTLAEVAVFAARIFVLFALAALAITDQAATRLLYLSMCFLPPLGIMTQ